MTTTATHVNSILASTMPSVPVAPRQNEEWMADAEETVKSSKIMIIDDEQLVVRVVRRFLQSSGYSNFVTVSDSRQAMETIEAEQPDVVLLDIMMPHVTGLDILRARQNKLVDKFTPFIILSASSDIETRREALKLGATEFLNKPVDPNELTPRVRNALLVKSHQRHLTDYAHALEKEVRRRTAQIERSRQQVISCLARAAEQRDNDTGEHVVRVGKYAAIIAEELGFAREYCTNIELAAQLHDVGKIGIPDSILLSTGKLTYDEFEVMKQHCDIGYRIVEPMAKEEGRQALAADHNDFAAESNESPTPHLMMLASSIAKTHHEKWDGSGYPNGLEGEQIPIEGRITAVADVFDALCSARPYKPAFPDEKCFEIMQSSSGSHFDPTCVEAFFARIDDILEIRSRHCDTDE